ncbi:MAG: leucyl aminopeptidase family protein [Candidatus Sumerlaeia bacterium]|nr:leucyl aminopeptidase family protein [Candidatus Sumerlaeia bacterium]
MANYKVGTQEIEKINADALVVICEEDGVLAQSSNKVLRRHWENFHQAVKDRKSSREWFCTLEKSAGCTTSHLLLESVAFGGPGNHDEPLKSAAARAVAMCRQHSLRRVAFIVHHKVAPLKAAAILEGVILGDFEDNRYKSNPLSRPELDIQIVVSKEDKKETRAVLERTKIICDAQNNARLLVNAPHHELTPRGLAREAQLLAKSCGLQCEVLDHKKLKASGYEPTWQVGRGSEYPPCMIILRHRPKKPLRKMHIGLAGKGMTFDSGGLSLKTKETIFKMNRDMAGAATVLGVMEAASRLDLPIQMTAVITAAHNAVDGAAYYPGAILKAKNGKTIFVENTDAEGRLILTDALHRLGEEGSDIIWDYATLTGACMAALGPGIAGLFTDDEELRTVLVQAGNQTGDDVWPLPLVPEYKPWLNHTLADVSNLSRIPIGGAIHAANFLSHFVPKGARWAHVDLAGPSNTERPWRYYSPGATGFGVRLTVEALRLLTGENK